MKAISLVILLIVLVSFSYAQDTIMVYYDAGWKETTRDQAEYHRKKIKAATGWTVIDYYHSGKMQMQGAYSDDSSTLKAGLFTCYSEKGNISQTCYYKDGKADGQQVIYYENGSKRVEGNYKQDKQDGEWIGYYPSGKISGKATYKDNEQTAGSFFTEDGKPDKSMQLFYRPASYPGSSSAFGRYLYHSLVYPEAAQKKGIQGSVIVSFMVRKDGVITDVKIAKSVEASLDREAMRVIKEMPLWTPAINGGILSDYYLKQPVTFKLEAP